MEERERKKVTFLVRKDYSFFISDQPALLWFPTLAQAWHPCGHYCPRPMLAAYLILCGPGLYWKHHSDLILAHLKSSEASCCSQEGGEIPHLGPGAVCSCSFAPAALLSCHNGLSSPPKHSAPSCLRAFARAVPSA